MDSLKVIVIEPLGSRRSFHYNVKTEAEAKEIVKGIKKDLKPNFSIASWKYKADKSNK